MTREQLQQIPTVEDLRDLRLALFTEIEGIRKTLFQLRDEMATSGMVKPKRIFCTPKEFGAKVGVSDRTVVNWLITGVLRGSQPNGTGTAWIIPNTEYERLESEALDAEVTVKQYMRNL
jgi:hypothetical protein